MPPVDPSPVTSVLIIFGATGDLASRKLWPAIYNLMVSGRLGEFRCIAAAMDADATTQPRIRAALDAHSRTPVDERAWEALSERIVPVAGRFDDPDVYRTVASLLDGYERSLGRLRRLCYFAVSPEFFSTIAEGLDSIGCGRGTDTRLVLEKPFGVDLESAVALNAAVGARFDEDQLYRIDHYLGKETVQNLLVLRFANAIFEPIWNRHHVSHVEITVAEEVGLGGRAGYYDHAGALLDVVQNHMMQLVALVAMEPPSVPGAEAIRDEKLKVLDAVRPYAPESISARAVRGRYTAGRVGEEEARGYLDEPGVPDDSVTETYAALRLDVDNWRWSGVPFFLRTGKALADRRAEIVVHFRPVPHLALADRAVVESNKLVISIQPDEAITMHMIAKEPGTTMSLANVEMEFEYTESFVNRSPEAYERLLSDAVTGDPTLFMRSDETERAWRIVTPIIDAWRTNGDGLEDYRAGSDGPTAADALLADAGYPPWTPLRADGRPVPTARAT